MLSKIVKMATPAILLGILTSSVGVSGVGVSGPNPHETLRIALQTAQCSEPCPIGVALDDVLGQYGKDLTPRLAIAGRFGPDEVGLSATIRRNSPGVATIGSALARNPSRMMCGIHKNAGFNPDEIAQQLAGQRLEEFRELKKAFWLRVADSKYASEFDTGNSPHVAAIQANGERNRYELHHIQPIRADGSVYDLSNLMITTPVFHREVLERVYHYGI